MTDIIENPAGFILEEPLFLNVGVPAPVQAQKKAKGGGWQGYHDRHQAALTALMGGLGWALVPEMSQTAKNDGRGALYVFKTYDPRWRPGQWPAPLKAYMADNFVDVFNAMELAIKKALGLLPKDGPEFLVGVRAVGAAAGKIAKAADEVQYLPGEEFWKHGDAD